METDVVTSNPFYTQVAMSIAVDIEILIIAAALTFMHRNPLIRFVSKKVKIVLVQRCDAQNVLYRTAADAYLTVE